MFMQWSAPLNPQNMGAGTALANSVTLTDISAAPPYTMPANFTQLTGATWFRIKARGIFSTTGTPTLLLGVYYGAVAGTALATTGATTTATATNFQWYLNLDVQVTALGSSGSAWAQGEWGLGTSATAMSHLPLPGAAPAAVTIDTTAAKVISIGAQWSAASASNTVQVKQFLIESVA